jgi:hypothetical protein
VDIVADTCPVALSGCPNTAELVLKLVRIEVYGCCPAINLLTASEPIESIVLAKPFDTVETIWLV